MKNFWRDVALVIGYAHLLLALAGILDVIDFKVCIAAAGTCPSYVRPAK